ncbi:MAG: BlaI/MecI/CopY family transcriptional regulator [Kiritimatiellae bacterium]|nr:BlaI/MecI/CopY family transcriptional regulator [Kiritimatiellia bacterium]
MAGRSFPQPTDAELAVLRALWDRGPSTVREVNDVLNEDKVTGYTTTLKFMQIMFEKGLLERDDSGFRHVYRPAISEARAQTQLVDRLLDKAFSGSAEKLVMRALSARKVSSEELAKIRKLIAGMGRERK